MGLGHDPRPAGGETGENLVYCVQTLKKVFDHNFCISARIGLKISDSERY